MTSKPSDHHDLEYKVWARQSRDTWSCPDPVDRRPWAPVARFTFLVEALDYCHYGIKRGATLRLRGPLGFERIYSPTDGSFTPSEVSTEGGAA